MCIILSIVSTVVYSTAASSDCPLKCSIQNIRSLCQYQCACGGYPNGIVWVLNGTTTQDGVSNDQAIYSQLTVPPHIANNTNITCQKVDSNARRICSNSTIGQGTVHSYKICKIKVLCNMYRYMYVYLHTYMCTCTVHRYTCIGICM